MTTTSVYSSYGVTAGEKSRPEKDWQAEREANKVPLTRLLKGLGWTFDDLEMAKAYGFPSPTGYVFSGWVNAKRESVYSQAQVHAWREQFEAFAATVK